MRVLLLVTLAALTVALGPQVAPAETPKIMKAVVAHEYGACGVLKFEDASVPPIKENELLVRVIAAGVNPADPLIVSGKYAREFGTHLPLVPGYDVAGVVEKVGAKVTRFKAGDAVYGYPLFGGGWAEFAVLREDESALKPKSLSFNEAAAVPLAALTAWQALIDGAQLREGQTVLIHGGSGGVGHFAIQIAKVKGARVIATASTANQDLLKQLGADIAVDYTKERFEDVAHDVDVVLDTVGGETLVRSYNVIKKGGAIASIRARSSDAAQRKFGFRGIPVAVRLNGAEQAEITKLIDAGKIHPVVTQVLPLSDAAKACEEAETHHTRGKIVLQVANDPASVRQER
jgi:NADPH:quinone reductase-like Zn-dependent oxidoreductase